MSSVSGNSSFPEAADIFNNLATLYTTDRNYEKAIPAYIQALEIAEKVLGPSHPNITTVLGNLGFAYLRTGRYDAAEAQFLRSLAILEGANLVVSNMGLTTLNGLGRTSMEKNQLERAENLLARAVETGRTLRARTPEMADTLELYSTILGKLSKRSDADNFHTEAARLRAEMALTIRVSR